MCDEIVPLTHITLHKINYERINRAVPIPIWITEKPDQMIHVIVWSTPMCVCVSKIYDIQTHNIQGVMNTAWKSRITEKPQTKVEDNKGDEWKQNVRHFVFFPLHTGTFLSILEEEQSVFDCSLPWDYLRYPLLSDGTN